MESLSVHNISKKYKRHTALKDISFTMAPGEFLSILGPSGCGKTTLLRILIGLLAPDEGRILLNGQDITHAPCDQRSMGIVFQNYALFEHMTVLKNVEYALRFHKESKAHARETALHMLELAGPELGGIRLDSFLADSSSAPPLPALWLSLPRAFCWMSL